MYGAVEPDQLFDGSRLLAELPRAEPLGGAHHDHLVQDTGGQNLHAGRRHGDRAQALLVRLLDRGQVGRGRFDHLVKPVDPVDLLLETLGHEVDRFLRLALDEKTALLTLTKM